jgi:regulatory protein
VRSGAGRRAVPLARQPESPEAAYNDAVRRLARQPQTRAALEQRLLRLGYTEAAVGTALARAQAQGYLDDRAYAASLVRRRAPGRGHALIARELRAKGIGEVDAGAALEQVEPDSETEQAIALGRRLVAQRKPADAEALYAFLAPRLARRGFSGGLVYRVCRLLADESQAAGRFDSVLERD